MPKKLFKTPNKDHKFTVLVTGEELQKIKARAEQYNLSTSAFARLILLNGEVKLSTQRKEPREEE